MRVIVTNKCQKDHPPRGVRKCPPNYKPKESEWILELDDYTMEDIEKYFSNEDLIAWKEEYKECK
tara:strand:- start:660 stop:854 length:195 start_codon:yes stop_codon:yes gene_type:complete